jgi:hypothetical protein
MLSAPAPFPYVGSYALHIDHESGEAAPAAELVRILNRAWFNGCANALIGFPLRDGASGNRWVAEADLIDPTPLTRDEEREYHDIDRRLLTKVRLTKKQKLIVARRDRLRQRMIWAPMAERLMRQADLKLRRAA